MFRILFIDEEQDDIDAFKDYIEEKDVDSEFEIITQYPLGSLDEMIDQIISLHVDAVVTDYMLNEIKTSIDYNIPYNGVQLIQVFLEERERFPCFVLTSFDDKAVDQSTDVNIVYIKGILHDSEKDTKAKANFLDRLKNQIIHYQKTIEDSENRLLELIKKQEADGLNAPEEDEMIYLDSFIEKSLDKRSILPTKAKVMKESDSISELLKKVDELTKKIDKGNE